MNPTRSTKLFTRIVDVCRINYYSNANSNRGYSAAISSGGVSSVIFNQLCIFHGISHFQFKQFTPTCFSNFISLFSLFIGPRKLRKEFHPPKKGRICVDIKN